MIAVIAAVVILGLGVLLYYQISEENKAQAALKKELAKPVEILEKLAP